MTDAELFELTRNDAEGALPPGYTRNGGLISYLVSHKKDSASPSEPVGLCGEFTVISRVIDKNGDKPGTLIEFQDRRGTARRLTVSDELIFEDGKLLLIELADKNLRVEPGQHVVAPLKALFADIANNTYRYRTAYKQAGWQGRGSFLLPDGTVFGSQNAAYAVPVGGLNKQAGTLGDWQRMVAERAVGNSRLIMAISIALAGPVLDLVDEAFACFHLVGASSTGKSTAATMAASVWGAPDASDQVRSWRTTDNALESVASQHSDTLLVLDEIAQIDSKIVEQTIYMLANGTGKARANRDGSARESRSWRLAVLSTGEHTVADAIRTTGKQHTAGGVDVRMANIPADAGAEMGLFENTHGLPPSEFADAIIRECLAAHGHAGREWITNLAEVRQNDELENRVRQLLQADIAAFLVEACENRVDGQITRVARKFALVAAAGELGITLGFVQRQSGWLWASIRMVIAGADLRRGVALP